MEWISGTMFLCGHRLSDTGKTPITGPCHQEPAIPTTSRPNGLRTSLRHMKFRPLEPGLPGPCEYPVEEADSHGLQNGASPEGTSEAVSTLRWEPLPSPYSPAHWVEC